MKINMLMGIFSVAFAFIIIACTSTYTEPTDLNFKGIDVDENTVFMLDRDDNNHHKIYVIDTATSKRKYTYDFKGCLIYNKVHDSKITNNIFLDLNDFYQLDTSNGRIKNIKIPYPINSISQIDDCIWVAPNNVGFYRNSPVEYYAYDLVLKKGKSIKISGGKVVNPVNCPIISSDKTYLPLYFDSRDTNPSILNLTDNREIFLYENKKYDFFHFVGNNFLYAYFLEEEITDIYKIESFEPLNSSMIAENVVSSKDRILLMGMRVFEDEYYSYFIEHTLTLNITKRKKNNYSTIVKEITIEDFEGGETVHFKNDHFWTSAPKANGVWKINKDLECTLIK